MFGCPRLSKACGVQSNIFIYLPFWAICVGPLSSHLMGTPNQEFGAELTADHWIWGYEGSLIWEKGATLTKNNP